MAEHPCANGLTPACFKAYPAYARKVLAYKVLMMMMPEELSMKLPASLLEIGKSLPPDWPPAADPPKFLAMKAKAPAAVRSHGVSASHIHAPFSAGPVHPPAPGPSKKEYTTVYTATAAELLDIFGSPWATKQAAGASNTVTLASLSPFPSITAYNSGAFFTIQRFIFKFNFASLAAGAEMVSGVLSIKTYTGLGKTVCVQRAPTVAWNSVNDYSAFAGAAEDPHAIAGVTELFNLSADSLEYCKTHSGQLVYFMAREYAHDFLNSAPAAGQRFEAQFYNQLDANAALRPTLTLVYKA